MKKIVKSKIQKVARLLLLKKYVTGKDIIKEIDCLSARDYIYKLRVIHHIDIDTQIVYVSPTRSYGRYSLNKNNKANVDRCKKFINDKSLHIL